MKIALVTDAWAPQINGVVRTLQMVVKEIEAAGHGVEVINPSQFKTLPCPTYPEIRLSVNAWPAVSKRLSLLQPDVIHIATEGPLGLMARHYCVKRRLPFTTSFHTKFPEYIEKRFWIPAKTGYRFMRWFHRKAERMMVATPSLKRELEARGFTHCTPWTRGVDTVLFHPHRRVVLPYPAPILLYVGRVAVEKNIEAFLSMDVPGTKLVVGDGPQRAELEARFPDAVFIGAKHGEELASIYASADVFVFPSLTDTFGLVMLEALACGTPVAAFPVTGPIDVMTDDRVGSLSDDLAQATQQALKLNRSQCRDYAEGYSWQQCAAMLLEAFAPIRPKQS